MRHINAPSNAPSNSIDVFDPVMREPIRFQDQNQRSKDAALDTC